jgi:hypothetical protein
MLPKIQFFLKSALPITLLASPLLLGAAQPTDLETYGVYCHESSAPSAGSVSTGNRPSSAPGRYSQVSTLPPGEGTFASEAAAVWRTRAAIALQLLLSNPYTNSTDAASPSANGPSTAVSQNTENNCLAAEDEFLTASTTLQSVRLKQDKIPAVESLGSLAELPNLGGSPSSELPSSFPAAEIPAVDSPTVDSPTVDSPTVDSPTVDSPAVDSPAVDSPAVDSPAAPPDSESPVDEPPVSESPDSEPPVSEPSIPDSPVSEPPVSEPSIPESPVPEPSDSESPVAEPPISESPIPELPRVESPGSNSPTLGSPADKPTVAESPGGASPEIGSPANPTTGEPTAPPAVASPTNEVLPEELPAVNPRQIEPPILDSPALEPPAVEPPPMPTAAPTAPPATPSTAAPASLPPAASPVEASPANQPSSIDPSNITPTTVEPTPFDGVAIATLASRPDGNYRYLSGAAEFRAYSDAELQQQGGSVFILRKSGNNITGLLLPKIGQPGICVAGVVSGNTVTGSAYLKSSEQISEATLQAYGSGALVVNQPTPTASGELYYAEAVLDLSNFSMINAGVVLPPASCEAASTVQ